MNYIEIVNLIFYIISGLFGLLMFQFGVFFVVGIFFKKKFPKQNEKCKYGILVAARNEESVIGDLIRNVKSTDYPSEKIQVFVIAHNCTDNTAAKAREAGAIVYEYNNKNERTKGYALKYLVKQIEKDYGINCCDGFYVFDADNLVSKNYFDKMNDAFVFYKKKSVITSFRNSKNFNTNTISGCYGIYFALGCYNEFRGRTLLDCSTRVSGTGYVVPAKALKNGWRYVTLTEDWELSADQIAEKYKIYYCDEAIFYDEQPTTFKIMWRQRVRWSKGHILVAYQRTRDLLKNLFSKENDLHMSTYDMLLNCQPLLLVTLGLFLIQLILTFMSPLFGVSLSTAFLGSYEAGISFFEKLLIGNGYLFFMLRNAIIAYIGTFFSGILTFIIGHKQIHGVPFWKKIYLSLMWPFFLVIQFPIDVQALFSRNLEWKVIPHKDKKKII